MTSQIFSGMASRVFLCLTMFTLNLWAVQSIPVPPGAQRGVTKPREPFPETFVKRSASTGGGGGGGGGASRRQGYPAGTANVTKDILSDESSIDLASSGAPSANRDTNALSSFGTNKLQLIDEHEQRVEVQLESEGAAEEPTPLFPLVSSRVKRPMEFETENPREVLEDPTEVKDDLSVSRSDGSSPCPAVPATWMPYITDRELQCVVNPYWLEFDPPSHFNHLVLAAIYILIFIVGCFGNGLVIYLFASSRSLRTPSNLFILNLALSDFCMVGILVIYVHNAIHSGPAAGKFGCDLYGFVGGIAGTTSIMTMAAISFDRYLVITYPLDPFKRLSYRQVLVIVLATWIYSSIFSIVPLLGIVGISYAPEGYLTTCSFDYLSQVTRNRIYIFAFFIAAWLLPLNIIFFSYVSIVVTVSKQERQNYTYQGTAGSASFKNFKHQSIKRKKNVELKLAKVASGIIALWVIAWTPYSIVALLGIFNQRRLITPFGSMVPAMICKAAACIDPYVYALSHPRFKNELKKRLLRRRPDLTAGGRNLVTGSTFSEIKDERDVPDLQLCETTDQSNSSSLGPLVHRHTICSSHPAIPSTAQHARFSASPGRATLAGETQYPRPRLSTNSFRKMSRSLNLSNESEANTRDTLRPYCDDRRRLQTMVLVDGRLSMVALGQQSKDKTPCKTLNGLRVSKENGDATGEQHIGLIMFPTTKQRLKSKKLLNKQKHQIPNDILRSTLSNMSLPLPTVIQPPRCSFSSVLLPSTTLPNIALPSEELEESVSRPTDQSNEPMLSRGGVAKSIVSSLDLAHLSLPCAIYVKNIHLNSKSKSLPNISNDTKDDSDCEENQYECLSLSGSPE